MDSGVVTIYSVTNEGPRGSHVRRWCTQKGLPECYENRVVGMGRYYAARQANITADRLIRIWRREDISPQDVARLDGQPGFYRIQQVQQVLDDDEMPVTDLTLERMVEHFDIAGPDHDPGGDSGGHPGFPLLQ